jgi:hypothetical protein
MRIGGMHWAKAACLYFVSVFGAGFVLGLVRVLWLVPRLGVRTAELIEMPVMVMATILAARWVVLCFGGTSVRRAPLRVGLLAFSLLTATEIGLGIVRGVPVWDYIAARDPVSGPAYFAALALFACMPVLVVRGVERRPARAGLIDTFIPKGDVEENHEIIIDAPADLVFDVAERFDLISIPVVRLIFRLRELVFQLRPEPRIPKALVEETMALGWRMLAFRPRRELVMGAVTQPWVGDVKFRGLSPDSFSGFAEPAFVKIVWTFEVEPLDSETARFRSQTRVLATDQDARRKFFHYWVFSGPFIVLIRKLANRAIRRAAERRSSTTQAPQLSTLRKSITQLQGFAQKVDCQPSELPAWIRRGGRDQRNVAKPP